MKSGICKHCGEKIARLDTAWDKGWVHIREDSSFKNSHRWCKVTMAEPELLIEKTEEEKQNV